MWRKRLFKIKQIDFFVWIQPFIDFVIDFLIRFYSKLVKIYQKPSINQKQLKNDIENTISIKELMSS